MSAFSRRLMMPKVQQRALEFFKHGQVHRHPVRLSKQAGARRARVSLWWALKCSKAEAWS